MLGPPINPLCSIRPVYLDPGHWTLALGPPKNNLEETHNCVTPKRHVRQIGTIFFLGILGYFLDFLVIFEIFGQILRFLIKIT